MYAFCLGNDEHTVCRKLGQIKISNRFKFQNPQKIIYVCYERARRKKIFFLNEFWSFWQFDTARPFSFWEPYISATIGVTMHGFFAVRHFAVKYKCCFRLGWIRIGQIRLGCSFLRRTVPRWKILEPGVIIPTVKVAHIRIVVPNKFWDGSTMRSGRPFSSNGRKNLPFYGHFFLDTGRLRAFL